MCLLIIFKRSDIYWEILYFKKDEIVFINFLIRDFNVVGGVLGIS